MRTPTSIYKYIEVIKEKKIEQVKKQGFFLEKTVWLGDNLYFRFKKEIKNNEDYS
jgi:hypothetical protein